MNWPDRELGCLIIGTFIALGCASLMGLILRWQCGPTKTIENLNSRIMAWWFMILVFLGAVLSGPIVVVVLFGLLSLLALREFLTLTPTRLGDHRALFWAFFVVLPIQYIILGIHWYAFFQSLFRSMCTSFSLFAARQQEMSRTSSRERPLSNGGS